MRPSDVERSGPFDLDLAFNDCEFTAQERDSMGKCQVSAE